MNQSTHNLKQYAVVIGRRAYLYKRAKPVTEREYHRPNFVGIKWFRNGVEATKFKHEFDA